MSHFYKHIIWIMLIFLLACSKTPDQMQDSCVNIEGVWNFTGYNKSTPYSSFFPDTLVTQLTITQTNCVINIADSLEILSSTGSTSYPNVIYSETRSQYAGLYYLYIDLQAEANGNSMQGQCSYIITDLHHYTKAYGTIDFTAQKISTILH